MAFRLRTALAAVVCSVALVAVAQAQLDPAKIESSKAAAASFSSLAKDSANTGEAPRESDPAVKRLLDAIYDASDVKSPATPRFEELTPLSTRMVTGVQAALVYMLAGTGAADLGQLSSDPDASQKINLNVIKFAPEMGRFFDFQLVLQGAISEAVAVKLKTATRMELANKNFQSGLGQIRDGGARVISGMIETLAVNGLTDDWRRARLPALTGVAPKMAKILQPEQKKQLQDLARACADVMDDATVKKALQDFAVTIGA
jgi:hypothetical protein